MPRPPRIQFEGATYHVYSRGNRRERIFWDGDDYAAFEGIMLEAMRGSGVQLFNWSQMPNHFHFHLETPEGNLSEFMQRLMTRFAKYFNWAHQLVGHVFQGRYGARLVDHESHFQEIVRYVELNPYRLKDGKLAEMGAWKWSSWRYYVLSEDQWPEGCQAAFRRVLERFGPDSVTARKNLARFLAEGLACGRWEDFYQVKDRRFVGTEAFIERAKRENGEPIRQSGRAPLPILTVRDLFNHVQRLSGHSAADLSGAGQARQPGRWRRALAFVARRYYRRPIVEIARALGRDGTTVSHMIERIERRTQDLPEIGQLLASVQTPKDEIPL